MTGLVHAQNLGMATIFVEDTRVAGHIQVSSLNVVLPDSLCLYIAPLSSSGDPVEGINPIPSKARWYIISGHQYLIQMKVLAHGPDAQEIYITEVVCISFCSYFMSIGIALLYWKDTFSYQKAWFNPCNL